MIDLKTEFRTLRLLSQALLIIGAGLAVGGFGIALITRDTAKPAVNARVEQPPATPGETEEPPPPPPKPKPKLSNYTSSMGVNGGLLGLLFLALGGGLRWIIRNNFDDDEVQMSDELFKAYADQLVLAEKKKQQNRKRMKPGP